MHDRPRRRYAMALLEPASPLEKEVVDMVREVKAGATEECALDGAAALLPEWELYDVISGCATPGFRDEAGQQIFVCKPGVVENALRGAVHDALRTARIVARGLDSDNIFGKPVEIPAGRWTVLVPDFARSTATCEGKTVAVGITIEVAKPETKSPPKKPISDAKLHEWFSRQNPDESLRKLWGAAREEFGDSVTRDRVFALAGPRRRGRRPK